MFMLNTSLPRLTPNPKFELSLCPVTADEPSQSGATESTQCSILCSIQPQEQSDASKYKSDATII
jgi:hypothetical protein